VSGSEVAIVIVAVFFGATVKGVTGMGLPLVAVPIMTLFVPAETAVAVITIPNIVTNATLIFRQRHARRETKHLGIFVGTGVVGALAGSLTLGEVSDSVTRLALAGLVATYLVIALAKPSLQISERGARRLRWPLGLFAGLVQGGTGVSGPIVGTWHHSLRLSQDAFVLSVSAVFLTSTMTQAFVLGAKGSFDGRLTVSLLLTALSILAVPVGARIRPHVSLEAFRSLVLVILAVSCVSLVAGAIG
jgi:uncharacterized membrane protein YfcA